MNMNICSGVGRRGRNEGKRKRGKKKNSKKEKKKTQILKIKPAKERNETKVIEPPNLFNTTKDNKEKKKCNTMFRIRTIQIGTI